MITVFTPTYNRAYTLPRLYESLLKQDCFDFEWLVINDGSTDNTGELFKQWIHNETFPVRYMEVANGGKQRAINRALTLAKGEYFFIVDSDDWLDPKAISFIKHAFATLPPDKSLIGLSGIKGGGGQGQPLNGSPKIDPNVGFIDASNLEREKWNLAADMAEVFFTDKLRQYSFPVWESENFTPEAVVWDQMAVDGYRLRWFNRVIYYCDYQPDGLTASTWKLLKHNPMGYALLFNVKLLYTKQCRQSVYWVLQFCSCCCLAKEYTYILKCHRPILAVLLSPFGWLLSRRRRKQINQYA